MQSSIWNCRVKDNQHILLKPLLLALASVLAPAALAQSAASPQWQTDAGGQMSFDVASIHQSKPGTFTPPNFPLSPDDAYAPTGGILSADFPLEIYIEFAYKLWLTPDQRRSLTTQLPKWVASDTDSYTIHARAAAGNPTKDQMRLMMQALLSDRFKLAVHFEKQQVPVLAATLVRSGKLGPNLRPHSEGPACDSPSSSEANRPAANDVDVFPPTCGGYSVERTSAHTFRVGSRNTTMALIAATLPTIGNLGRPGVDQTGLSGRFDFTLEWTPERRNPATSDGDISADALGATFLEALKEQLGLKFQSAKAPMDILVVDHIERPSEN
jgi:uncharacterized protein (TIGR03435 family)